MKRPTAKGVLSFLRRLATASVVLSSLGCGGTGTSLLLQANFDSAEVTQLRASGDTDAGAVFGPLTRPEMAGGPLRSGQTLRVLLPDALAGRTIHVSVAGLKDDGRQIVSAGQGDAVVRQGAEIALTIYLQP